MRKGTEIVIITLLIGTSFGKIATNGLHKTSKGMLEINYQDTQQFERATMMNNLLKPLLVLCGVSRRYF